MAVKERVTYDDAGKLDEVVVEGGAQLERMDDNTWFLQMIRADECGGSFCVWFTGKITMTEDRK